MARSHSWTSSGKDAGVHPATGQSEPERSQIEAEVESIREWLAQNVRPQLRGAQVRDAVQQAELEEEVRRAKAASDEIERLRSRIRQASGEAGAGRMSAFYATQATSFRKQANRFFGAVIVSVL